MKNFMFRLFMNIMFQFVKQWIWRKNLRICFKIRNNYIIIIFESFVWWNLKKKILLNIITNFSWQILNILLSLCQFFIYRFKFCSVLSQNLRFVILLQLKIWTCFWPEARVFENCRKHTGVRKIESVSNLDGNFYLILICAHLNY